MRDVPEEYAENPGFLEFLGSEFDKTAADATVEKLAEFAFGGVNEALEAFEEYKKVNDS